MWQAFIDFFIQIIEFTYHLTVDIGWPSYGLAIVFMSIAIKLVLFPVNQYQLNSMRRMQQIQPKLKELQERYKNDKEKFNEKVMALYSEYKINPLGGCLPLLIQMPIFIAFYRALSSIQYEVVEHAGFLWVPNIAEPDPYYGFAVLAALTTFLQQRISMVDVKDPTQRTMLYVMPLMMGWIAMSLPAGLPLYWIVFNILGILQQLFVNKKEDAQERARILTAEEEAREAAKEAEAMRAEKRAMRKNKEAVENHAESGHSKKGKNRR